MTNIGAGLPGLTGLSEILDGLRGSTAYLIPMTDDRGRVLGNNGDELMHRVFMRVLGTLDIRLVSDPADGQALILPPSGSILEKYSFPSILRRRLAVLPDVPLTIFPSSALFPTTDPSGLFGDRRARTTWILRERISYSHLQDRWGRQLADAGVDLLLDHDIVASGHQFVPGLIGRPRSEETVLIAARNDREARTTLDKDPRTPGIRRRIEGSVERLLPYGRGFTFAGRVARRQSQRGLGCELAGLLPEAVSAALPGDARRIYNDISAVQFATFDEYCAEISRSKVVITNRLHVALPACILGKEVHLVESSYGKLRGVYEQSLAGLPNITLLDGRTMS